MNIRHGGYTPWLWGLVITAAIVASPAQSFSPANMNALSLSVALFYLDLRPPTCNFALSYRPFCVRYTIYIVFLFFKHFLGVLNSKELQHRKQYS